MALRASISTGYLLRLAGMAIMLLGYAGWSAYDGFIGYPAHNKAVETFEKLKDEHPSDWKELWAPLAKEKGWSENGADPGKPHARFDIATQFIVMGATLVIGGIFAISLLSTYRRWVECDENGLAVNGGQRAPYSAITNLNKERWPTKGIAVVTYTAEDNLPRKLILDDWKFDRTATKLIVVEIEKHITPDKITGVPELPDEPAPTEADADTPKESGSN